MWPGHALARHPLPLTSDTLWSARTPSDSFPAAATLSLSLRARSATLSPPGHTRGREHLDRGHAAAHPHQHTHAPAGGAHVPIHPAPPRLGFGSFYCCPASLRAAWNSRRANNATCKPNNIENVIHQSYKFICCFLHALAPPPSARASSPTAFRLKPVALSVNSTVLQRVHPCGTSLRYTHPVLSSIWACRPRGVRGVTFSLAAFSLLTSRLVAFCVYTIAPSVSDRAPLHPSQPDTSPSQPFLRRDANPRS